jgi:hypothetical protein
MLHILSVCLYPYISSTHSACSVVYCYLWPVLLHHIFPHHLINSTTFGKKLLNMKCVLIFCTTFAKAFLILRIRRGIIINVCRSSYKVSVIIIRLKSDLNFLDRYWKNTQISNFMKILPVADELFHVDGRTDRNYEANSRFSQFCENT